MNTVTISYFITNPSNNHTPFIILTSLQPVAERRGSLRSPACYMPDLQLAGLRPLDPSFISILSFK